MENLQQLINQIKHLYPQTVLPRNIKKWNAGHKCLAYFEQKLPADELVLHSWLLNLVDQSVAAHKKIKNTDVVVKLFEQKTGELFDFRDRCDINPQERSLQNIKKLKIANCEELAWLTHLWFSQHNILHQMIDFDLYDKETGKSFNGHTLVVFSNQNNDKCNSYDSALAHLPDSDMYVCDLWLRQCLPTAQMFNRYANIFTTQSPSDGYPFVMPADKIEFIVANALQRLDDCHKRAHDPNCPLPESCLYFIGQAKQNLLSRSFKWNANLYPNTQKTRLSLFTKKQHHR